MLKQCICIGFSADLFHRSQGRGNQHFANAAQQRMIPTFFLSNHYKYQETLVKQDGRRNYLPNMINNFVDTHASGQLNAQTGHFSRHVG